MELDCHPRLALFVEISPEGSVVKLDGTTVVAALSALVALISALVSWWFAWRATRPKPSLKVRILYAHHIRVGGPGARDYDTCVLLFCWITNESTHPVHLVDFQGEVDQGSGYTEWDNTLRVDMELPRLTFRQGPYEYTVELTEKAQIFWPPSPVEYGKPLIGFLAIAGNLSGDDDSALRYRVRVEDIFGHAFSGEIMGKEARSYVTEKRGYGVRYLFQMAGAEVSRERLSSARRSEGSEGA